MGFWIAVGVIIAIIASVIGVYRNLYKPVGYREALVITGGNGTVITDERGNDHRLPFRVVTEGGTFINPFRENVHRLSLAATEVEIIEQQFVTRSGEAVAMDASLHVKFGKDSLSLLRAAHRFLNKPASEIVGVTRSIVLERTHQLLQPMTTDEALNARNTLTEQIEQAIRDDLALVGLEVAGFVLSDIRRAGSSAPSRSLHS